MISVIRCRELLGSDTDEMGNEEVERLRNDLYIIAEIAIGVMKTCAPHQQSQDEPVPKLYALSGLDAALTSFESCTTRSGAYSGSSLGA